MCVCVCVVCDHCGKSLVASSQIANEINQYGSLKKLGCAYNSKPSHSISQTEAQAKKQTRQRDEQNFLQQASAGPQSSSPLTPVATHLY